MSKKRIFTLTFRGINVEKKVFGILLGLLDPSKYRYQEVKKLYD